jgi:hypothetical protein
MQRNPALKQALIWGISLGIIQVIVAVLAGILRVSNPGLVLLLELVAFLIALAFYLLAGLFAARQTHRVSTGTFAGMLTGVFQGILGFIAGIAVNIATVNVVRRTAQGLINTTRIPFHYTNGIVIAAAIVSGLIGLTFAVGLGAGLGALGGLIGRGNVQQQPPYMPYPGQPYQPYGAYPYPYPPQPGQPGPFYQGMPPYPPQQQPGQPYPAQAVPPYPVQQQAAPTNEQASTVPPTTPLPPQE